LRGDKGEWWRYIVSTFVNVIVYVQYNNNIKKNGNGGK
jgi:hypothetical protein